MTAEADALNTIKTILSGNWTSSNTDNLTPGFYINGEQPPLVNYITNKAIIILSLVSHPTVPGGLGPNHVEQTVDRVSIKIVTKNGRSHLRKVYNECRRLFSTRINAPDSNFQQLMPVAMVDSSEPGYYEYNYDIFLRNWTVVR